jgi:hypothetical protein
MVIYSKKGYLETRIAQNLKVSRIDVFISVVIKWLPFFSNAALIAELLLRFRLM